MNFLKQEFLKHVNSMLLNIMWQMLRISSLLGQEAFSARAFHAVSQV